VTQPAILLNYPVNRFKNLNRIWQRQVIKSYSQFYCSSFDEIPDFAPKSDEGENSENNLQRKVLYMGLRQN